MRAAEKNWVKAPDNTFILSSCNELINNLNKSVEQVKILTEELIELDKQL